MGLSFTIPLPRPVLRSASSGNSPTSPPVRPVRPRTGVGIADPTFFRTSTAGALVGSAGAAGVVTCDADCDLASWLSGSGPHAAARRARDRTSRSDFFIARFAYLSRHQGWTGVCCRASGKRRKPPHPFRQMSAFHRILSRPKAYSEGRNETLRFRIGQARSIRARRVTHGNARQPDPALDEDSPATSAVSSTAGFAAFRCPRAC